MALPLQLLRKLTTLLRKRSKPETVSDCRSDGDYIWLLRFRPNLRLTNEACLSCQM